MRWCSLVRNSSIDSDFVSAKAGNCVGFFSGSLLSADWSSTMGSADFGISYSDNQQSVYTWYKE
jgi:hypothetical protein